MFVFVLLRLLLGVRFRQRPLPSRPVTSSCSHTPSSGPSCAQGLTWTRFVRYAGLSPGTRLCCLSPPRRALRAPSACPATFPRPTWSPCSFTHSLPSPEPRGLHGLRQPGLPLSWGSVCTCDFLQPPASGTQTHGSTRALPSAHPHPPLPRLEETETCCGQLAGSRTRPPAAPSCPGERPPRLPQEAQREATPACSQAPVTNLGNARQAPNLTPQPQARADRATNTSAGQRGTGGRPGT